MQDTAQKIAGLSGDEKGPQSMHVDESPVLELDERHANYLLGRHGTIQLDPLPSADPQDPLNWPSWRKNVHLGLFSFHALSTTFMAAGIIPAYIGFATEYKKSLPELSYLTSVQVSH